MPRRTHVLGMLFYRGKRLVGVLVEYESKFKLDFEFDLECEVRKMVVYGDY